MTTKNYILNKKERNTKTSEVIKQKYKEDPEFREKCKQRAREQYKRRLGIDVYDIKKQIDIYEDELNTVHGEYKLYKKAYEEKTNEILNKIHKLQMKLKSIRRKEESDTLSLSSNDIENQISEDEDEKTN
jgi:3-methyladenine DNA glycosylase/8-oxoguanine DNA glycosylase